MKVCFCVSYRTTFGQNIVLSGNCTALGNWNPDNAVPMSFEEYELWSVIVDFPCNSQIVEYKYILQESDKLVCSAPAFPPVLVTLADLGRWPE
jgi:hypothetical protein